MIRVGKVPGTKELRTSRLLLRRHVMEDAAPLHEGFGTDPAMFEYSGWNPYATLEMAESTVADAIASCFGSLRPDLRHGVEAVVMRNLPTA